MLLGEQDTVLRVCVMIALALNRKGEAGRVTTAAADSGIIEHPTAILSLSSIGAEPCSVNQARSINTPVLLQRWALDQGT
jgi:hypothetical protein